MDLVLGRFLDVAGPSLDEHDRTDLERLLDRSDREILDWLGGRTPLPADAGLAALLARIRTALRGSGVDR